MATEMAYKERLPSYEERQKVLERAGLILIEARALANRLDRTNGSPSIVRPGETEVQGILLQETPRTDLPLQQAA